MASATEAKTGIRPVTIMNLLTWSLVFMRASALLAVFPLFSSRLVPARLRVALGALLAFLITVLVSTLVYIRFLP